MARLTYEKLGIKEGMKCASVFAPGDYRKLTESPLEVRNYSSYQAMVDYPEIWDFIHVFTNEHAEVEEGIQQLKSRIAQNGMIWFSWYKKSSKKQKSVNEDIIRDTALASGLVDVKVCSINEEWSALKLVIPLKLRK